MSSPITLVLSYYQNPAMLQHQYKRLFELPDDIKSHIHLMIVDDGSPRDPLKKPPDLGLLGMNFYRMDVDIRWNQDACRNVGVRHAETEWLLLTDMDHIAPPSTWRHLITREWDMSKAYTFSRLIMPKLDKYKPHPNSWFLTRKVYDAMGGYDERFAGIYGTDGDFKERLRAVAEIKDLKEPLIMYPRTVISDASTTDYLRKQPEDDAGKRRVKAERMLDEDRRPKRYLFPYNRI